MILSNVHNGSDWHIEEIIIEINDKDPLNQFGDKTLRKKYLIKTSLKPFESS